MNCMTDAVKAILDDAVKLCESVGYSNAGTVEFLVEPATGTGTFNSIPVIII
jgi:pyruvate carboxylase